MDALAARIDHTMLAMNMQRADVLRRCTEAITHSFASVCVPSYFVPDLTAALAGSPVKACTVIGFPFGYHPSSVKALETTLALAAGAQEIDLVINQAAWFSGDKNRVRKEVAQITQLCHEKEAIIKAIIETGYLPAADIDALCLLCAEAGTDFVKTSTGFGKEGAQLAVVEQMRRILPKEIRIKASGGIRDRDFALALVAAGADRIGTSSGVKMMES